MWGELLPGVERAYPAAAYAFIADRQAVVLDGVLTVVQGGAEHDLGPGDCLRFGPPQDAAFGNRGAVPCRYSVAVLRAADGVGARSPRPADEPD